MARSFTRPARRLVSLPLLLVGAGVTGASYSQAQPASANVTNGWLVYGSPFTHTRDDDVPGRSVVIIEPSAKSDEPWSSGAGMPIPHAIIAGEQVTAVFWARAARPARLTISMQGGAPTYVRFAAADVTLTQTWQRVSVSGRAPTDFAMNSQSLSVPLGRASTQVILGPAAFLHGDVNQSRIKQAFATFNPTSVMTDVRIASEPGVVLAGTLHTPASQSQARFPIAVLIQGHGPNGRGGYAELIKRLNTAGIAALEYDKRGVGQSTGIYKEDVERLTADAAAAVAAMRHRPELDGSRVALIGHSQGGVIAPAVAASDPTIAALVTLAGSVGDGLPYLRRALHNQMIAAGHSEAVATPAVGSAITLLQARIDGKDAETIAPLRAAVINRFEAAGYPRPQAEGALAMIDTEEAWRADKLRSASDLKALHIPVLAVFGTKDTLVVASDEADAAQQALAGNPRGKVVVLDGLNHWFQEVATTGQEVEVAQLGPNAGSPRMLDLVGRWLSEALARSNDGTGSEAR